MADAGRLSGKKRPRVEPSTIKNKMKRSEVFHRQQLDKNREKREARERRRREAEELGEAAPAKAVPRTLENTRELEETLVNPDDEEVLADEADDEFAAFFRGEKEPKIMITTKIYPSGKLFRLIAEILAIFPNSFYYKRGELLAVCGPSAPMATPLFCMPAYILPRCAPGFRLTYPYLLLSILQPNIP